MQNLTAPQNETLPIRVKWTAEENQILLASQTVDEWVDAYHEKFGRTKPINHLVGRWKFHDILVARETERIEKAERERQEHEAAEEQARLEREAEALKVKTVVIARKENPKTEALEVRLSNEILVMSQSLNDIFMVLSEMGKTMKAIQMEQVEIHDLWSSIAKKGKTG